ncbi:hypothetical protein H5T53_02640 [Candidatus Bipolaricaulota bacterium]|nr:hypothetical protein [Candidatus Bipolaricaulota bacterium]
MRRILAVMVAAAVLGGAAAGEEIGFGVGGVLVGVLPLDLSALNVALLAAGYPVLDGQFVVIGGGGVGGVTGGPVFGGLGFGGSATAIDGERRSDLDLGFGGFTVEVARPAAERTLVSVGAALGGGSLDLTVRARYPVDFTDAIVDPTSTMLSLGFVGGLGYLRLQIQALDWLWIEGWLGYLLGFPGRWTEGGRELAGPPVQVRAPFFGVKVSFGGMAETLEEKPAP